MHAASGCDERQIQFTFLLLSISSHPLRRWRAAPWIVAPADTRCGTVTVRACEAAGFTPDARHVVDDFPAVLALVAIGGGVALVPQLGVTARDAEVVLTPLPMHRRTLAAHRRGAAGNPAIAAFVDAMRAAATRIMSG